MRPTTLPLWKQVALRLLFLFTWPMACTVGLFIIAVVLVAIWLKVMVTPYERLYEVVDSNNGLW